MQKNEAILPQRVSSLNTFIINQLHSNRATQCVRRKRKTRKESIPQYGKHLLQSLTQCHMTKNEPIHLV